MHSTKRKSTKNEKDALVQRAFWGANQGEQEEESSGVQLAEKGTKHEKKQKEMNLMSHSEKRS